MRGVVTAAEMKALDANTIEKAGIPSLVLMERAALQTATEIIIRRIKRKSWWSAEPGITEETDWQLPDYSIYTDLKRGIILLETKRK